MKMPEQKQTDALTKLADKYNMTQEDRTALFMMYLSTHNPEGYTLVPNDIPDEMMRALIQGDTRKISLGYWEYLKDSIRRKWKDALALAPKPKPYDPDKWGEDGSVF
jgi:hypothetical protein